MDRPAVSTPGGIPITIQLPGLGMCLLPLGLTTRLSKKLNYKHSLYMLDVKPRKADYS